MKDEKLDHPFEANLIGKTSEEKPFHVVLVDLKKAAFEKELVCVEKPLMDSGDLKFVALSYRWGELHETTVDTGLGYLASIISFDLKSFFLLCNTMAGERDLKDMDYVWVDAICVDQSNYERRKATIYQMTNIYERANYIVAVPDMHLRHLETANKKHAEIIQGTINHSDYIYHLIQGSTDKLIECDHAFLDDHDVPKDRHLRHLLRKYTNHFADGFTNCKDHDPHYDDNATLHHIFQTNQASRVSTKHHHGNKIVKKILKKMGYDKPTDELDALDTDELHKCDNVDACPLRLFDDAARDACTSGDHDQDQQLVDHPWKRLIPERSATVRQSMEFLADLIQDWSTRVWVISEYNIAKRKESKKMKYWFIQLTGSLRGEHNTFFEFDFYGGEISSKAVKRMGTFDSCSVGNKRKHESRAVYQTFHATVQQQLNQQTFLEMILKSKASRPEDRFHAILPSSEYKHKLTSKEQVARWHITTLISIKLQLYDWMNIKHKLELLFLSSRAKYLGKTLPTFATSTIDWPAPGNYPTLDDTPYPCNFDMADPSAIMLIRHQENSSNDDAYKLNIKPKEYYQNNSYQNILMAGNNEKDKAKLYKLIQLDPASDLLDMICIPNYSDRVIKEEDYYTAERDGKIHYIYLIGCFKKNRWLLRFKQSFRHHPVTNEFKWKHHYCDKKEHAGFDIY